MKNSLLLVLFLALSSIGNAQNKPGDKIVFNDQETVFPEYPDIKFRISEPYLRYQKWDPEHTGAASLSVALEIANNSADAISALSFKVKIYGKSKKVVYEATSGAGPMTFEPKDGNVLKPGYKGIYDAFINKDVSFYEKIKKIEYTLTEVKIAAISLNSEPEFPEEWLTFDGHEGLKFKLSTPYTHLDDLSGSEVFAIASKFKNTSGKQLKFIYFMVKVYDDQGILFENEVQQHNQMYLPQPKNFMNPNFPIDYEGINKKFYTSEKSLFEKFKKIEISIVKVE